MFKNKIDGHDIFIGKSAKGNDELITIAQKRDPNSWWIHLHNLPSAHAVMFVKDIKPYLEDVTELLLSRSKKAPKNSSIILTQVKNVTKTDILGLVQTVNAFTYSPVSLVEKTNNLECNQDVSKDKKV
jgi:predicted ribosome quality control (RQC) complex YloA/Tae2 family protein